jgi:predicted kinase
MPDHAKLICLCGKMAAGKSTLARALAAREQAVLLVQDEWLSRLFPGEILDVLDYSRCSTRLTAALAPHIVSLLSKGLTVVLDFPGNTAKQRAWFRELFEAAPVEHELHFIDASDDVCKRQLRERSAGVPPGTPWTTEAEFDLITSFFQPPTPDEGFKFIIHECS